MVFVLLGRDSVAPRTIRAWCMFRVETEKNNAEDAQIKEALACADAMEEEQERMNLESYDLSRIRPVPRRALLENLQTWSYRKGALHLPETAFHMPAIGRAKVIKITLREKDEKFNEIKEGDVVWYHTSEESLKGKYAIVEYGLIVAKEIQD